MLINSLPMTQDSLSIRNHSSYLLVRRVLLRPVLDAEVLEARYAAVEWGVDTANMETLRHLHACLKSIRNVPVIEGVVFDGVDRIGLMICLFTYLFIHLFLLWDFNAIQNGWSFFFSLFFSVR